MAIDIVLIQVGRRIIVYDDHICRGPFFQHAKRRFKIAASNNGVVLKKHPGHFAPCRIGIAQVMLMQHVGYLVGFRHIVGIPVGSKSGQYPAAHQLHSRGTATGIAHIGFWIMDHHRARIFDQIHFVRINIDTVAKQRLLSQYIPIHQPVHDPLAILLQAVMKVFDSFGHMDMIACLFWLIGSCQFHSRVRDGKLRMHSHHSCQHI